MLDSKLIEHKHGDLGQRAPMAPLSGVLSADAKAFHDRERRTTSVQARVRSRATGRRLLAVANALRTRLVRAIAEQDESALAGCFAPDVELRALTPRGLRERAGAVCTSRTGSRVSRRASRIWSSSSCTAPSQTAKSHEPISFAPAFGHASAGRARGKA